MCVRACVRVCVRACVRVCVRACVRVHARVCVLQVIFTMGEVNFVQNLVYYIERAYRTPDFGMWQRGRNDNSGRMELHARLEQVVILTQYFHCICGIHLMQSVRCGPFTERVCQCVFTLSTSIKIFF